MKTITCPPLCGVAFRLQKDLRGNDVAVPVEFGLVEYVQDVLLLGANTTPELCDFTLRIMEAIPRTLRGPAQVGKTIELDHDDWKLLCALARKERNPGSPENLVAFAICNRAILLAETVKPAQQAAE